MYATAQFPLARWLILQTVISRANTFVRNISACTGTKSIAPLAGVVDQMKRGGK
jgi:hypothetical protein